MEPTTMNMPVLALRGLTVFPHMNMTFDVERRMSIAALERAMSELEFVGLAGAWADAAAAASAPGRSPGGVSPGEGPTP